MDEFELEWDSVKSNTNRAKHGVDFDTAALVFEDRLALRADGYECFGELRYETFGTVGAVVLRVTHTSEWDGDHECIRIISARKADKPERERYEENCFR